MSQCVELFRRLDSIDARIFSQAKHEPDNVAQHVEKYTDNLVEIEKRVRSLELLLTRASLHDFPCADALVANSIDKLDEHCKGREEPAAETSPKKEPYFFDREAACESNFGNGSFAEAAVYDVSDKDAAAQSTILDDNYVSHTSQTQPYISDKDVAVQINILRGNCAARASLTQVLPKPRRSRCNGRATQTDMTDTCNMGVQVCSGMVSAPLQAPSGTTTSEKSDIQANTSDVAPAALCTNVVVCAPDQKEGHEGSLISLSLKGHI
ncbi:unnamed protein product [Prorocentrum cordatum]|uniref:Spindle and kinetochore-associated protein 3 n=1 Tax=Prorocentrum cordatum TaxID=2364126 RepID=A0ABN9WK85_9DINO|nr:unnamed protein product [Polarella glacialis]